jgi:cytochrome c553
MSRVGGGCALVAALMLLTSRADGTGCYPVVARTYYAPPVTYHAPPVQYVYPRIEVVPPTVPLYVASYYQDDTEVRVLKAELRATNAELRALRAEIAGGRLVPRVPPLPYANGNGLPEVPRGKGSAPEAVAGLAMCAACHEAAVAKAKGGGHIFFKGDKVTMTPEQRGQAIEETSVGRMPKDQKIAPEARLKIIAELVGAKQ